MCKGKGNDVGLENVGCICVRVNLKSSQGIAFRSAQLTGGVVVVVDSDCVEAAALDGLDPEKLLGLCGSGEEELEERLCLDFFFLLLDRSSLVLLVRRLDLLDLLLCLCFDSVKMYLKC